MLRSYTSPPCLLQSLTSKTDCRSQRAGPVIRFDLTQYEHTRAIATDDYAVSLSLSLSLSLSPSWCKVLSQVNTTQAATKAVWTPLSKLATMMSALSLTMRAVSVHSKHQLGMLSMRTDVVQMSTASWCTGIERQHGLAAIGDMCS